MNSNYTTDRNTDRKSTEELKQQVIADIKKVKQDFEEIKQRMTPGQLVDDAIFYRSGRSPADTFEHLKANPVGTSLLTLGTLLLMEDENHRSYESYAREKAHVVTDKVGSAVHSAQGTLHNVQDKIHSVQDKFSHAKDRVNDVKERMAAKVGSATTTSEEYSMGFGEGLDLETSRAGGVRENVQSKFQDVKERVGSKFENVQENVREGVAHAKSRMSDAADSVRTKAHDAVESAKHLDPLTYLALGAGLGTITGAALPISDKESDLVDSKFEQNLSNFSTELQDALNESINILKNEFIGGFTEINMRLF